VLALAALFLPLIGSRWAGSQGRETVQREVLNGQNAAVTALFGRLDVAYDTAVRGVSSAADRPGLTRAVADHDAIGAAVVLRNVRELGFYGQLAVYDEAGALLASDPLGASPRAAEPIPDAAVVSPPMPGPNGVVVTVRAAFRRDGRQLGQLVADVAFPQLVGGTEGLHLRGGVDVTIVDSNFVILASALGPSVEGQKILAPEARALIQRGTPGTATYFAPRLGYDVVSAYLVAAGRPWGALAASKSDVVFARANALDRRLFSGGLLIAGLSLAAAALVAAYVGAAERRLRRAQATIAKHNESLATQAAELRETVDRLDAEVGARRQLIDTATDAFVSIDATGLITGWNNAAEAIFGWSHDEAVGAGVAELLIPKDTVTRTAKGCAGS